MKAKSKYKNYIKKRKKSNIDTISDNLHDSIVDKDQTTFWKIWKSKFGRKNDSSKNVHFQTKGEVDDHSIANEFADYYSKNSKQTTSKNIVESDSDATLLLNRLLTYTSDNTMYENVINSNVLQNIIHDLSNSKAAGYDKLSAEHLKYCHPAVIASINILFSILVICNYVPNDFGIGILVPIPKEESGNSLKKLDDFRGITISPVISKLFETALYKVIGISYLMSSDSQFGFK